MWLFFQNRPGMNSRAKKFYRINPVWSHLPCSTHQAVFSSTGNSFPCAARNDKLFFRRCMQIPTHGGEINIALTSEAVAHIQHRDILTLQIVEGFEGQHSIMIFCNLLPFCEPFAVQAVDIVNHAQAINVVELQ